ALVERAELGRAVLHHRPESIVVVVGDVGAERDVEVLGSDPAQLYASSLPVHAAERADLAVVTQARETRRKVKLVVRIAADGNTVRSAVEPEAGGAVRAPPVPDARELRPALENHLAREVEPIDVAVAAFGHACDAGKEILRERDVEPALHVDLIEAAPGQLRIAGAVALRFARHDPHRAAERIHPEQRPLRAAQDLDALGIVKPEVHADLSTVEGIVDIERDRRGEVGEEGLVDLAAHSDDGRFDVWTNVRVWYDVADALDRRNAVCFEVLGCERGNRKGRLLKILFPESGRDDDFLQRA